MKQKNSKRMLNIISVLIIVFCGALFIVGASSQQANAAPSPVTLKISSDVPSLDGSRCDAVFVVSGQQAGQVTTLELSGLGRTADAGSFELTADANGQSTQTVNTVDNPSVANGTYWVSVVGDNGKTLVKAKITVRCG
jgi:hypothetical protein